MDIVFVSYLVTILHPARPNVPVEWVALVLHIRKSWVQISVRIPFSLTVEYLFRIRKSLVQISVQLYRFQSYMDFLIPTWQILVYPLKVDHERFLRIRCSQ
jgi:hypothetical protein